MAFLLQKRLCCFYCGKRSASTKKSPALREWRCEHCEAVNYLDENGEITDPPTAVTNPHPDPDDSQFESVGVDESGIFCSKCVRNQQLLLKVLGSYLPDSDDPAYPAFEREYPRFRRHMEERYPQVCENCEQRVNDRIRQAVYYAKTDHLRRLLEQTRIRREARRSRRRNWRSLLARAGEFGYWTSVAGQLLSDLLGTYELWDSVVGYDRLQFIVTLLSYVRELVSFIGYSSQDVAGIALIAGVLSIWWNPKVHDKVEGFNGRLLGLNQYYQCQLIVMVTRFAVWALLKDSNRMKDFMPSAIHAVMLLFMSIVAFSSQRLVKYDTRPLVLWSETIPTVSAHQQTALPQARPSNNQQITSTQQDSFQVFPVERLGAPQIEPTLNAVRPGTPPQVEDSMDWTPSAPQEIRPRFVTSSRPEIAPNVLSTKSLFRGSLPEAPRPPAWQLRNPVPQKQRQIVSEPNVFQKFPATSQNRAGMNENSGPSDVVFAPPRFFAPSDYYATTGLESLFDQTFTIRSPEDDMHYDDAAVKSKIKGIRREHSQSTLLYTSIRLALLSVCLLAWSIDWMQLAPIPHDAVLISALIMNILITGFNFLASLNEPSIIVWSVLSSLIKFFATVVLALAVGYNFSITFYQGGNLELCLKCLTSLLAIEDIICLFSAYSKTPAPPKDIPRKGSENTARPSSQPAAGSQLISQNQQSSPPLSSPTQSFYSFPQGSFTQSHSSALGYGPYKRDMRQNYFHDDGSDVSEYSGADSDTETTVTSYTNKSIRNMNPFGESNWNFPPPRARGLGSGLQGLSLDDSPTTRRITRSQTMRRTGVDADLNRHYHYRRAK